MAAYAAVVSLMNTMEQIQNHPRFSSSFNKEPIESLREMLDFLLDFIETYNSHGGSRDEVEALETQIVSAAHAAEDVIESHTASQVVSEEKFVSFLVQEDAARSLMISGNPSTPKFLLNEGVVRSLTRRGLVIDPSALRPFLVGEDANRYRMISDQVLSRSSFSLDQQKRINREAEMTTATLGIERSEVDKLLREKIIQDMDSIKEKVTELRRAERLQDQQQQLHPTSAAPPRPLTTEMTTVVGFDGYLVQLLDWLTGQHPDRQTIPITGMGGIGKTTLARMIYEHSLIVHHFDVRVWITVSQEYDVKEILNRALSYLGESTSQLDGKDEDELGRRLHKVLFGRRYLIILDDMWSIKIWDKIRFFFPENNDGSRVVVTTRQLDVAYHFGSLQLALSCLNDDESWSLFCKKVFSNECCPSELEMIGKKIVEKCKGLPLSIIVIGGILRKSFRVQYWENIARGISSILNLGADNHCFDILYLSYSHLSAHLKPCFLYLGVFPEDHEIRVSLLVKFWVAEGFLKPNKDHSLEEVAEGYIKDLVDRNLILVRTLNLSGKTKTFSIHDLLRDLCLRIAEKEKFFAVTRLPDTQGDINKQRRIIFCKNNAEETLFDHIPESSSLTRSVIWEWPAELPLELGLLNLRVLFAVHSSFLYHINQPATLRFVACKYENTPSSISKLSNVQTIIMTKRIGEVNKTFEIWDMRQLMHLKCNLFNLSDPPPSKEQEDVVLRNLQTLKTISNFRCSAEVCKRMPNIKKLRILYGNAIGGHLNPLSCYGLHSVDNLTKLESLKCSFYYPSRDNFLEHLSFPTSLKKLTLENCGLHWSDLTKVGLLPHLEVVKLFDVAAGTEWNPVEGEFRRLIFLGIYGCSHLISWRANASHFPVLEQLVLKRLWKLEEIPLDIGEIPTFERISVYDCNISAAISAIEIQREQENLENHDLKVEVGFSATRDLMVFQKKLEEL